MSNEKTGLVAYDLSIIPEGYEAVRFGLPEVGELYLTATLDLQILLKTRMEYAHRFIIRKIHVFPEWMPKGWWLTEDSDRRISLHKDHPRPIGHGGIVTGWESSKGQITGLEYLDDLILPWDSDDELSAIQCIRQVT